MQWNSPQWNQNVTNMTGSVVQNSSGQNCKKIHLGGTSNLGKTDAAFLWQKEKEMPMNIWNNLTTLYWPFCSYLDICYHTVQENWVKTSMKMMK